MRSALLFAVLLAVPACRDECNPATDQAHCEGHAVVTCAEPGVDQMVNAVNRWATRECAGDQVCAEDRDSGIAVCALSAQPDPSCAAGASSACESDTRFVYCSQGYATARYACLSCSASSGCVGGPSSKCSAPADCASPYACGANGYCQVP